MNMGRSIQLAAVLFVFIQCVSCGFGGTSETAYPINNPEWIQAYTLRQYSGYSTPAVAANGDVYVIHDTKLQHYNSSYTLLSEQESVAASDYINNFAVQTDLKIDPTGKFYLGTISNLYYLDTDFSVLWHVELPGYHYDSLQVFEDGAFLVYGTGSDCYAAFFDNSGQQLYKVKCGENANYFTVVSVNRNLFVIQVGSNIKGFNTVGAEIYSIDLSNLTADDIIEISAIDDYVAVASMRGIYLYRNGEFQWNTPVSNQLNKFLHVLMPNAQSIVAFEQEVNQDITYRVHIIDTNSGESQLQYHTELISSFYRLNETDYLEYRKLGEMRILTSRSLEDTSVNWNMDLGGQAPEVWTVPANVSPRYTSFHRPVISPDGSFFVVDLSTLKRFSEAGQLIWEQPATEYKDSYVPAHFDVSYDYLAKSS